MRELRLNSILFVMVAVLAFLPPGTAQARVRLENICTVYGQKEVKLTGIGLVVGLNGSGDGGDSRPATRALAAALQRMNTPIMDLKELKDSKNVALVMIEATIPRTGLRAGQRIDCFVNSFMGAKSLRGGRLLVTPVTTPDARSQSVLGLASGAIYIEGSESLTTGRIPGGIVLERDIVSLFVDKNRGHVVTLMLDEGHATFHSSREVARVINAEFSFESGSTQIARAVGPGTVEVKLPSTYHDSPVEFIAQVLEIGIDNPHSQARVVVNARTGTVIVTGEVEISPAVITHKNLTVNVGDDAGAGGGGDEPVRDRFVPLVDRDTKSSSQQLKQLVDALNQLRVPTSDIIEIIRELHRSGKLHAAYEER